MIFIKDIINLLSIKNIEYHFYGDNESFIDGICTHTELIENKIGFYRAKTLMKFKIRSQEFYYHSK